jgi:hypothetical protein
MIVAGTSSEVLFPAAERSRTAMAAGAVAVEVNPSCDAAHRWRHRRAFRRRARPASRRRGPVHAVGPEPSQPSLRAGGGAK